MTALGNTVVRLIAAADKFSYLRWRLSASSIIYTGKVEMSV